MNIAKVSQSPKAFEGINIKGAQNKGVLGPEHILSADSPSPFPPFVFLLNSWRSRMHPDFLREGKREGRCWGSPQDVQLNRGTDASGALG